jgi:hypothetical protein
MGLKNGNRTSISASPCRENGSQNGNHPPFLQARAGKMGLKNGNRPWPCPIFTYPYQQNGPPKLGPGGYGREPFLPEEDKDPGGVEGD